ncbi:DUF3772 domain-containing protein [Marivita cryptomonadis]|uniref:DUF3772 domain-containing protein n=1 Tax=Marivita cryptomonadis TaxID=505252 RepID=UPI00391D808C
MTRHFAALRTATFLFLLAVQTVWAQSTPMDYTAWEQVASRAETAIESRDASTEALEALRSDVSSYRDRLLGLQNAGDPRLSTLQSQLEALGPAPEDGSEPEEISQRRQELQRQITQLQAPLLRAEEAYSRADGLINAIDEIIRSRETERLLQRDSGPLDPRLWGPAVTSLFVPFNEIASEVKDNWSNEVRRKALLDQLPVILLLFGMSVLLVFRAPKLIDRLGSWLRAKTRRGTGVWSTLLSLLRLLLPTGGLLLFVLAFNMSGLLGTRGTQIIFVLPLMLFVVLVARWLAAETFSSDDDINTIALSQQRRTEARYYVNSLSWLLALNTFFAYLIEIGELANETQVVLGFVIHLLCGLILFRLGQILRHTGPQTEPGAMGGADEVAQLSFPSRLARLTGQGAMLVGVVGPLLSAIGYFNIAEALIFPTILTLGLFALLLMLQRLIRDLYHLFTGSHMDESSVCRRRRAAFVLP